MIKRILYIPTLRCNCNCMHCGQHRLKDAECSPDLVERRLLEYGYNCGMLSITGGEPFLKAELPEAIANIINQLGTQVDFTTNGTCLPSIKKLVNLINDKSKLQFSISIDGLPEIHDKIRELSGCFEQALETVKYLKDSGIEVKINTVIQPSNIDVLEEFERYIKTEVDENTVISWIVLNAQISKDEEFPYSKEKLEEVRKRATANFDKAYLDTKGSIKIKNCHAGESSIVIAPTGEVYACLTAHDYIDVENRQNYKIGDLRTQTLYDIEKEMQSSNAKFKKYVHNCKGCWNPCEVSNEILFYGMSVEKLRDQIMDEVTMHKGKDILFNQEIDVAQIMQEIKAKALAMQPTGTMYSDTESSDCLTGVEQNLSRIGDFIQNTLNDSVTYQEMGAVIPIGTRWKGILRKMLIFFRRLVRKSTRFLVEDQMRFNQLSNQNIKALMDGQEQLRQAIVYLKQELEHNSKEHQKNEMQLSHLKEHYGEKLALQDDHILAIEEKLRICQQAYEKFQAEIKQTAIGDEFYKAFEDCHRGSEDEIKNRLTYYIPYIEQVIRNQETEYILDLGCGRGEWLELLKDHHYTAKGVDMNETMVNCCIEKGLNVTCEDAISYLKKLPDCSVKMITGFQLGEHLRAGALEQLVEEAYRVLQFHGILLLELPNCKNIEVGSSNFYNDPTHIRPVSSEYLEFMAKYKGFYETQTVYWKQQEIERWLDSVMKSDETTVLESPVLRTMLESMKKTYYIAPDYAVLATK